MHLGGHGRRDGLDQVVESKPDARVVRGSLAEAFEVGSIAVRDDVVLGCKSQYLYDRFFLSGPFVPPFGYSPRRHPSPLGRGMGFSNISCIGFTPALLPTLTFR